MSTSIPLSQPEMVGNYLPFVYLQIAAVRSACGLSTSSVYVLIKAGKFPPGDLIGAQSRRWKSTDIAAWLNQQAEKASQREAELSAPLKRKSNMAVLKKASLRKEVDHAAS